MPDTSDTSATRTTQMRHDDNTSNTSETRATQVQNECYTNDTSVTRVLHERHECDTNENFDFNSDMSKNIFLHPYIYYMVSERLQGEE